MKYTSSEIKNLLSRMRAKSAVMVDAAPQRRRVMSDREHRLQCSCVVWFKLAHHRMELRLFAVPNGGSRHAVTAARLKAEGVLPGVADLILLVPNKHYHALLIEMKTPKGKQSQRQKLWQQDVTRDGQYKYVVCRTLEQFKQEVEDYINDT